MSNYPKCEDCKSCSFLLDNDLACSHDDTYGSCDTERRREDGNCGPTGKLFRQRNPQPAQGLTVRQEVALRLFIAIYSHPESADIPWAEYAKYACKGADEFLRIEQETRPK